MKPTVHVAALIIVALTISSAFAETAVNCDDVIRHLKSGASPRDLADTTSISINQVEECQKKADVKKLDRMREREESDERRKPVSPDANE